MQDGEHSVRIPPVVVVPTTTLGGSINNNNNRTSGVQQLRMQRTSTPRGGPGMAVRSLDSSTPPIPPPRPESTLTSRSRPIVPVKSRSATTSPPVPTIPPRPPPEAHLVMLGRPPSPPLPPLGNISLTSPRPGPNRTQNLYVDAPLRSPPSAGCPPIVKQPLSRTGSIPLPQSTSKRVTNKLATTTTPGGGGSSDGKRPLLLVSQQLSVIQPPTSTLKKRSDFEHSSDFDGSNSAVTNNSSNSNNAESIICRDCGRCRCKACREPRRIPEHYLCHKKCLCSPETVVDTLSGMCLVKALFYHCGKDYVAEADSVFENPCSCSGDYVGARWGCMAAMSLVMPCLLCYLPLKGCAQACQAVYSKCNTNGCRCENNSCSSTGDSNSGLFAAVNVRNNNIDSDSSSSSVGSRSPVSSSGPASPADSEKRLLSEL